MRYDHIEEEDPEIFELMRRESLRQNRTLDLIASENLASEAVLEATGSIFTNKYAEGYPTRVTTVGARWQIRLRY